MGRFNQITAVKALTNLREVPEGIPRKPIVPLSEDETYCLKDIFSRYNIIQLS